MPTVLRILKGNPGKRAVNKDEPESPVVQVLPEPPEHLGKYGAECWQRMGKQLQDMQLLTHADLMALELLAASYDEWRECNDIIADEGRHYESENESGGKIIRGHPAVAMAADAWRRGRQMMLEFGLTPSVRGQIKAMKSTPHDPFSEFMNRGPRRA